MYNVTDIDWVADPTGIESNSWHSFSLKLVDLNNLNDPDASDTLRFAFFEDDLLGGNSLVFLETYSIQIMVRDGTWQDWHAAGQYGANSIDTADFEFDNAKIDNFVQSDQIVMRWRPPAKDSENESITNGDDLHFYVLSELSFGNLSLGRTKSEIQLVNAINTAPEFGAMVTSARVDADTQLITADPLFSPVVTDAQGDSIGYNL